MAVSGDAAAAADCFTRAWLARTDDFEAAVAAHYMARAQPDAAGKLAWDARAAQHAEAALAAGDARVQVMLASLYLNLGDGLLSAARRDEARAAAMRAEAALAALADDGYRRFVAAAIARLRARAQISRDASREPALTDFVPADSAAAWWGGRRLRYNLSLLAAGAIAFVCYASVVWTRCAGVDGAEVTIFTTVFQGIAYLLTMGVANLCYYLGPVLERFVAPAHRTTYRRLAFRAGLLFSVALPFVVPLLVFVRRCVPFGEP